MRKGVDAGLKLHRKVALDGSQLDINFDNCQH